MILNTKMMKTMKNLIAAVLMFVCTTLAATDYTANTGTITEYYDVYDYEVYTHTINVPDANAIKVTISMDLNEGMDASDGCYGILSAYVYNSSYSTTYVDEYIEAYYPENYIVDSYTFYVPNNIILELEGDMYEYWGGITVVYENASTTASSLLTATPQWLFDADANNYYIAQDNSAYGLKLYDKNKPAITVNKDGKLGIGMQATNQLDIAGATKFSVNTDDDVYLKFGNYKSSFDVLSMESRGSAQIVIDSDNNNGTGAKAYFDVRNDGTENAPILRVHQSGRVGIGGVEDPDAALHVDGDSYVTGNIGIGGQADNAKLHVYGQSKLVGNSYLTGGKVGIGTTSPDAKLHVNGITKLEGDVYNTGVFRTTEVIIEVEGPHWPDYVFESDYNLLDLMEVEAHIAEKGHLPSIPSAAQVAEEGVSLGEMNKLLLQKVEELTLYIIEQQKQIDELKTKVN